MYIGLYKRPPSVSILPGGKHIVYPTKQVHVKPKSKPAVYSYIETSRG